MDDNKTLEGLSPEEMAEFKEFQATKRAAEAAKKEEESRLAYKDLVDESIEQYMPILQETSQLLKSRKEAVINCFAELIKTKGELYGVRSAEEGEQFSHTFTNRQGDMRIIVGNNTRDNYLDTVNEGIAMVEEYLASLCATPESQKLHKMVMRLLAKDNKGTLKASRVATLRKIAEESNDQRFIDGVKVIDDAYSPIVSSTMVRALVKRGTVWIPVPLGITEA